MLNLILKRSKLIEKYGLSIQTILPIQFARKADSWTKSSSYSWNAFPWGSIKFYCKMQDRTWLLSLTVTCNEISTICLRVLFITNNYFGGTVWYNFTPQWPRWEQLESSDCSRWIHQRYVKHNSFVEVLPITASEIRTRNCDCPDVHFSRIAWI